MSTPITPEDLERSATSAATAWRLVAGQLASAREELSTHIKRAAQLEEDLATERTARAHVEADLATSRDVIASLRVDIEELEARLAQYETPPPPPPPDLWQEVRLMTYEGVAPALGTLVSVGAVLPTTFAGKPLTVRTGAHRSPIPHQIDTLRTWDDGSRHVLLTVPYAAGPYEIGAAKVEPSHTATLVPQLPPIMVAIVPQGSSESTTVRSPSDISEYDVRLAGSQLWEGRAVQRIGDQLDVFFDVRVYRDGTYNAYVKIENTRHDRSSTVTYGVKVYAGGTLVYSRDSIVHHHHAIVPIKVDPYGALRVCSVIDVPLWESLALTLPYGRLTIPEKAIASLYSTWKQRDLANPMSSGLMTAKMGEGGGRMDIGPYPTPTVTAMLSGDSRAYQVMFDCAARSCAYPIHVRDSDLSIYSVTRHPTASYRTPSKLQVDQLATGGTSPNTPDNAHQPDFCTVPYLITGHRWMLDESIFFAEYGPLGDNYAPGYRDGSRALLKANKEARSQAWRARNLFNTWRIVPDSESDLRRILRSRLRVNGDWYTANAITQNSIGAWGEQTRDIDAGLYKAWPEVKRHTRMWQVDYFSMVTGWMVLAGLKEWEPLAMWLAAGAVSRWRDLPREQATAYGLAGQDANGTWFEPWSEVGKRSPDGKSDWRPDWTRHYQVHLMAVHAIAHRLGVPNAKEGYDVLHYLTVEMHPEKYASDPTFNVRAED